MNYLKKQDGNVAIYIIIAIIVIVLVVGGVYFLFNNETLNVFSPSIKNKTITAENYDEISEEIEQKMKNDEELYYLSYSMMYYMMRDGMASAFDENADESAMYANIYGKTVQQLIDEGKKLMKDNNVTIESYKKSLEEMNQNIDDFNDNV